MAALWMIGYEDQPERSAEICICEIFGRNVDGGPAAVGMGVHPFGDPAITDDFAEVRLPIDVREFHEYAAEWRPDGVTFFVDGDPVRSVDQAPQDRCSSCSASTPSTIPGSSPPQILASRSTGSAPTALRRPRGDPRAASPPARDDRAGSGQGRRRPRWQGR